MAQGVAPARDVAFALQRYWEARGHGVSILEEVTRLTGLSAEAAEKVEGEAQRLIHDAGGDPAAALFRRGGLER